MSPTLLGKSRLQRDIKRGGRGRRECTYKWYIPTMVVSSTSNNMIFFFESFIYPSQILSRNILFFSLIFMGIEGKICLEDVRNQKPSLCSVWPCCPNNARHQSPLPFPLLSPSSPSLSLSLSSPRIGAPEHGKQSQIWRQGKGGRGG